jgi:hypothetical protein
MSPSEIDVVAFPHSSTMQDPARLRTEFRTWINARQRYSVPAAASSYPQQTLSYHLTKPDAANPREPRHSGIRLLEGKVGQYQ